MIQQARTSPAGTKLWLGLARLATLVVVFLSCALGQVPEADPAQWHKFRTPDIVLFSNAERGRAEELARHFQVLHESFAFLPSDLPNSDSQAHGHDERPVEVLFFGDAASYLPFRLTTNAPAFHIGIAGRNLIVLSDESGEALALASHEYFHVVTERAGVRLPFWLAEGLADFYSTQHRTLNATGDPVLQVGDPISRHLSLLNRLPQSPLDIAGLLGLSYEDHRMSEPTASVRRYAESWLLVHMLRQQSPWKESFPAFVEEVIVSNTERALARVYGVEIPELQQAATRYLSEGELYPAQIPLRAASGEGVIVEPAELAAWEVPLLFADVMAYRGYPERARRACDALATRFPNVPEIHESLAAIALDQLQMSRAQQHLEDAVLRNSRSGETYYRLASLVCGMQTDDPRCMPWLQRAVLLAPGRADILGYASDYALNTGRYEEALGWLDTLSSHPNRSPFQLLHQQAYANYRLEQFDKANRFVKQAWQLPLDAGQRKMLRHMERAITEREEFHLQMQLLRDVPGEDDGSRQTALTRLLDRFSRDPDAVLEKAKLLEIRCSANSLSLLVESSRGRIVLAIEDPMDLMVLEGTSRVRELDLTCGDADALPLLVGYIVSKTGDGPRHQLRILQFLAPQGRQHDQN